VVVCGDEPTLPAKSVRHEGQGTLGMWLLTDAITDYASQVTVIGYVWSFHHDGTGCKIRHGIGLQLVGPKPLIQAAVTGKCTKLSVALIIVCLDLLFRVLNYPGSGSKFGSREAGYPLTSLVKTVCVCVCVVE